MKNDLIVFSHLRYEFVWQRPQHIISRLAKKQKVLFVEDPIDYDKKSLGTARVYSPGENITVFQPRLPRENFLDKLPDLLKNQIENLDIQNPILWFYTPMFYEMALAINHSLIVFDVMDQLSAFKGAPPELIEKEKKLFKIADVVFTGGRSLYEEKKKYHDNVFCFPSSVEEQHFAKALLSETEIPNDIANIPKPIAGYYGVIDERIDTNLLEHIAKSNPDVSFVMIGPVVKISEDDLPKFKNIFYLGPKKYEELPNYLKAFDVAMMPFALNESTKFISPTKTLEFMAALKPIVSTPISDVVRDYDNVVAIAKNSDEFSEAIIKFLQENHLRKKMREEKEKQIVNGTSWDKTVADMQKIMANNIKKNGQRIGDKLPIFMTLESEEVNVS